MPLKIKSTIFTWLIFMSRQWQKIYILNLLIKVVNKIFLIFPSISFYLICFCSHLLLFRIKKNCYYILAFKFKHFHILLYRTFFLLKETKYSLKQDRNQPAIWLKTFSPLCIRVFHIVYCTPSRHPNTRSIYSCQRTVWAQRAETIGIAHVILIFVKYRISGGLFFACHRIYEIG